MENLLSISVARLQATARQFKTNFLSGADALKQDDKARRTNIEDSMLHVGDVIVVPELPENNAETAEQWVAVPMQEGGKPILRVLCQVTDNNGNKSYKALFAGTLTKTVRNRETGASEGTTGTVAEAIKDCATNVDVWHKVAGKTIKVTAMKEVPIIRRGFNGNPDRDTDTQVLTLDFA